MTSLQALLRKAFRSPGVFSSILYFCRFDIFLPHSTLPLHHFQLIAFLNQPLTTVIFTHLYLLKKLELCLKWCIDFTTVHCLATVTKAWHSGQLNVGHFGQLKRGPLLLSKRRFICWIVRRIFVVADSRIRATKGKAFWKCVKHSLKCSLHLFGDFVSALQIIYNRCCFLRSGVSLLPMFGDYTILQQMNSRSILDF